MKVLDGDGSEKTHESEEDAKSTRKLALKVNPDGTVEQEDTVRLVDVSILPLNEAFTLVSLGCGSQDIGSGITSRSLELSIPMWSSRKSELLVSC